jgi:hypothetical protein
MIGYLIIVTCRHSFRRGNGVFVHVLVTLRFSLSVDKCDIHQGNHQWFFIRYSSVLKANIFLFGALYNAKLLA